MADSSADAGLPPVADAWLKLTGSVVQGATAANKAAMDAFLAAGDDNSSEEVQKGGVRSVTYDELDWTFERSAETRDDLGVGDTVTFSKVLDDNDVRAFARAGGDTNRLHLDDGFAAETRFGGRIAHGTLVSGLISAALARLPGLTIYLSQDLEFRHPVQIGDRITAEVEVVEDLGEHQYRLETIVLDEDEDTTVINGEAVVLVDELPDA